MNKNFTKVDIQGINEHLKRFSISLAVREVQIKTIIRYHNTPIRNAKIKANNYSKCFYTHKECGKAGSYSSMRGII